MSILESPQSNLDENFPGTLLQFSEIVEYVFLCKMPRLSTVSVVTGLVRSSFFWPTLAIDGIGLVVFMVEIDYSFVDIQMN